MQQKQISLHIPVQYRSSYLYFTNTEMFAFALCCCRGRQIEALVVLHILPLPSIALERGFLHSMQRQLTPLSRKLSLTPLSHNY